ncbi:MAG: hypothetical protein HN590_15660 [Calditrichaeota bacterium]|jgi:hypothetical protein|nr:hypothetical protein [Deltaproteobacteria bacterium]MBT4641583.1 hypothetical protein [Deltaproteobacteria bacterium]MBT7618713.1 hypothetical protein [Calditrichota bacterium]
MDSPLSKLLEWYQEIPILHQTKLALFIMKTHGISTDNDDHEKQGAEKWVIVMINRFIQYDQI